MKGMINEGKISFIFLNILLFCLNFVIIMFEGFVGE